MFRHKKRSSRKRIEGGMEMSKEKPDVLLVATMERLKEIREKKSADLEKVRAITELCTNCVRDYRHCDVCLEVFGEVI